MSTASKPLTLLDGFNDITVYLSSVPLIGVLFGTLSTAIIQSSSAAIGILQGLHAESIISLNAASFYLVIISEQPLQPCSPPSVQL